MFSDQQKFKSNPTHNEIKTALKIKRKRKDKLKTTQQKIGQQKIKTESTATNKNKQNKQTKERKEINK